MKPDENNANSNMSGVGLNPITGEPMMPVAQNDSGAGAAGFSTADAGGVGAGMPGAEMNTAGAGGIGANVPGAGEAGPSMSGVGGPSMSGVGPDMPGAGGASAAGANGYGVDAGLAGSGMNAVSDNTNAAMPNANLSSAEAAGAAMLNDAGMGEASAAGKTPEMMISEALAESAKPAAGSDPAGIAADPQGPDGAKPGLSMADSLALAGDNLTSAGQAAKTADSLAIGLDQIGANDPAAEMAQPNVPLTPAPAVPGSIGSVSGVVGADNANGAAPYNPFMANTASKNGGMKPINPNGQQSSMNVPMGLQPKTEKFSGEKKKMNVMQILPWAVALIAVVAAVIFAILWRQAAETKQVVYTPANPSDGAVSDPDEEAEEVSLACSMEMVGDDLGIDGLAAVSAIVNASFLNDEWLNYTAVSAYNFTDAEKAEAARGGFDLLVLAAAVTPDENGDVAGTAEYAVDGATITYTLTADVPKIQGNQAINSYGLALAEDGSVIQGVDAVKAYYEEKGFVCE